MGRMDDAKRRKEQCRRDVSIDRDYRSEIPSIIDRIVKLHDKEGRFSHIGPEPIPSKESVIGIIERAMRLIYPGYFSKIRLDEVNISYYFGQEVMEFFQVLSDQIAFAIQHDCLRFDLPCTRCEESGSACGRQLLE